MSRLVLLGMVFALPVSSAEVAPVVPAPLSLSRAAELVLQQNPRLLSAPFGREAAMAQREEAGLKPAYAVGLEIENFAGTGELSGFDAAETTLSLSRIFEPSDLRSGRMSVAGAQSDQLENELDAQRLDLMTSLARRFLAVVYLQETMQFAQSSVAMWQESADMAEVRERAGIAPEADRLRAELRLVNARLQVEDASHELQGARTSLAATWGDTTASYGQAIGELCGVQELAAFEEVAASLQRNPDMLRFATEQRLYEASAQLAEARKQPPWTLSAGVRRLEQFDDHAFVLGVTVPLGSPSRASIAQRSASALRQRSELEERAEQLEIRAALNDLYQALLFLRTEIETFDREILPRAAAIVAQIDDGYRVGRFNHLELINARSELIAAQTARLTSCSNYQLGLINIERLTGGGSVWLAGGSGVAP